MRTIMQLRIVVLPLVFGIILAGCKLSGRLTNLDGDPMEGVAVHLSGDATSETITDANGEYLFEVPNSAAVYTITPVKDDWVFDPPTRRVDTSVSRGDIGGLDFAGLRTAYTLQGRVTSTTGESFPGAEVTLSGDAQKTTLSDENGEYSFVIPTDEADYTITAAKGKNFVFYPASLLVHIDDSTVSDDGAIGGLDFTANALSYSLIGYVETTSGEPMAGVKVRMDIENDGYVINSTNLSGRFTFQVSLNRAYYTLAPISDPDSGYTFSPESISISIDSSTLADDYNCIYGFDFVGTYQVDPVYQDITYYHNCDNMLAPSVNGGDSDNAVHYSVSNEGSPTGTDYWDDIRILFSRDFGATELYPGNFSIERGRIGFYLRYSPVSDGIDILFGDSDVDRTNLDDPSLFFTGLDENGLAVQYKGAFAYYGGVIEPDTWAFIEMKFEDGTMTLIIDGITIDSVNGEGAMNIPVSLTFAKQPEGIISFDQILASDDPDRDLYAIRNNTEF